MDLGSSFVAWCPYRGYVECQSTWNGRTYLLVDETSAEVPMGSSLLSGMGSAPAKAISSGGSRGTRGTGLVSQTAMRA